MKGRVKIFILILFAAMLILAQLSCGGGDASPAPQGTPTGTWDATNWNDAKWAP